MKLTLDTNCLVDLEEERADSPLIRKLSEMADLGFVQLGIPTIMASEKQPNGQVLEGFPAFQRRLENVGLSKAELLMPPAYFDVTYFDFCLYGTKREGLDNQLFSILFPTREFDYKRHCLAKGIDPETQPPDAKWLNAICDVLSIWCHIYYKYDVFVTNDKNFFKQSKQEALRELGAGHICRPNDAINLVSR